MIVFDIETGPAPMDEIEASMPEFTPPANYRDEAKIAAWRADKRQEYIERAALDPRTGRVLAFGCSKGEIAATGDERYVIESAWRELSYHDTLNQRIVGFCIKSFDLPFLARRSWALGIDPPPTLFRPDGRWNENVCDLLDVWRCNNRDQTISLDGLARFLGVGRKTGDGKDFARLLETDREAALAYLRNDVELTAACAARMGIG